MLRFWKRNYSVVPDFEPHSVIKIISGTKVKTKPPLKHDVIKIKPESAQEAQQKSKINEMGIQMISKKLFQQVFKQTRAQQVDQESIERWVELIRWC